MHTLNRSLELVSLLDAETQFILKCSNAKTSNTICNIETVDWDKFLTALKSHRMTNVVYESIKENKQIPEVVKQQWKEQFVTNKYRLLHYTAELSRVIHLLQNNGIDTIALKGPMLGYLYYDDYTQRECSDLDVLVKPHDLQIAYQLLTKSGYKATDILWNSPRQKAIYLETFHHYCLYNQESGIQLELHWRLSASQSYTKEEQEKLWANSIITKIGGVEIQLLSKYDNFLYLCVHGGRHQWKRLFWVQDIVRIIEREGQLFVCDVYELAKQQKLEKYVLEAFHLAFLLFGVSLPESIDNAIKADEAIEKLTKIALFSMKMVTYPAFNPLSSISSFKTGVTKMVNHYLSVYYLGSASAFWYRIKLFLINPSYWKIFAFSDRFFYLNYFASPFFWIYSVIKKYSR